MSILITAPTILELAPIEQGLKDILQIDFHTTGIGLLPTVYNLSKILCKKKYSYIFQIGIAGTFNPSLSLGSTCIVGSEQLAHQLLEDTIGNVYPLPPMLTINTPLDCPLIKHIHLIENIPIVRGLTVTILTEQKASISQRIVRYSCDIETMEGAAFHYVCLQENVPFIQMRGVSNKVGCRNKAEWKVKEALNAIAINLKQIITHLPCL
ncbi:MAG: hypothetical protein ACRCSB_01700 [Bacteroidales bacterium]